MLKQIYHTTTNDGKYAIELFTNGDYIYVYLNNEEIYNELDHNNTFETVDFHYYVGIADVYYESNYM